MGALIYKSGSEIQILNLRKICGVFNLGTSKLEVKFELVTVTCLTVHWHLSASKIYFTNQLWNFISIYFKNLLQKIHFWKSTRQINFKNLLQKSAAKIYFKNLFSKSTLKIWFENFYFTNQLRKLTSIYCKNLLSKSNSTGAAAWTFEWRGVPAAICGEASQARWAREILGR